MAVEDGLELAGELWSARAKRIGQLEIIRRFGVAARPRELEEPLERNTR